MAYPRLVLNEHIVHASTVLEVHEVCVSIEGCLTAPAVRPVVLPVASVEAAVRQLKDTDSVALAVIQLANVLVELRVYGVSDSRLSTVKQGSLVHKTIFVKDCADSMHLVILVNLAVVNEVLLLNPDELLAQIWAELGIELGC